MRLLSELASMSSGNLRKIITVKSPIDLQPDSRLAFQHPYWAGLKTKEHEGQETEWMLKEGVIEPAVLERANLWYLR